MYEVKNRKQLYFIWRWMIMEKTIDFTRIVYEMGKPGDRGDHG